MTGALVTYLLITTALALTAFGIGANAKWGAAGEGAVAVIGVCFALAASYTALGTGLAALADNAVDVPYLSTVLMLIVLLTPVATWVVLVRNHWKEAIPLTIAWLSLLPLLAAGVLPNALGQGMQTVATAIARVVVQQTQGLMA